uniref:PiggyBac transposable element-derived protein domain-containing protein n=1 Tax=Amphimedon queenslandica TaxID=400682 RepID=A0A1X7VHC6_AMPQE
MQHRRFSVKWISSSEEEHHQHLKQIFDRFKEYGVIVNPSKTVGATKKGLCYMVVTDLVTPYRNEGYHVYMDNFYTSSDLYMELKRTGFQACGTIKMIEKTRKRKNIRGTETIKKPRVVEDYNQHMNGVDLSDQMVLYYGYGHRAVKWWKRPFFHFIDLELVNANILYNEGTWKPLPHIKFRIAIVKGLLKGHTYSSRWSS